MEGDVDVKPIPRSYGEELALCQRYYTQFNYSDGGYAMAAGTIRTSPAYNATYMRANPIGAVLSPFYGGVATSIIIASALPDSVGTAMVCNAAGQMYGACVITLDAEL